MLTIQSLAEKIARQFKRYCPKVQASVEGNENYVFKLIARY